MPSTVKRMEKKEMRWRGLWEEGQEVDWRKQIELRGEEREKRLKKRTELWGRKMYLKKDKESYSNTLIPRNGTQKEL